MEHIDKYLEILEIQDEFTKLNESDLSKLAAQLSPEAKTKALLKKMQSLINKKHPVKSLSQIKSLISFMPKVKLASMDRFVSSKIKDYKALKKTADIILGNSLPDISNKSKDYASSFLALSSFVSKKGAKTTPKDNLKKQLKEFVIKTRRFMDDHEDEAEKKKPGTVFQKEDLPDLAVAWTIVIMTTALAAGLGTGVYVVSAAIATAISTHMIFSVSFFVILIGVLGGAWWKSRSR